MADSVTAKPQAKLLRAAGSELRYPLDNIKNTSYTKNQSNSKLSFSFYQIQSPNFKKNHFVIDFYIKVYYYYNYKNEHKFAFGLYEK